MFTNTCIQTQPTVSFVYFTIFDFSLTTDFARTFKLLMCYNYNIHKVAIHKVVFMH